MFEEKVIDAEERLVWLRDPTTFRYVREGRALTTRRHGRLGLSPGDVLVGYAEHRKRGRGIQPYSRRFWWLKPRDLEPSGTRPVEAIDPSSIAHLYKGLSDDRCT